MEVISDLERRSRTVKLNGSGFRQIRPQQDDLCSHLARGRPWRHKWLQALGEAEEHSLAGRSSSRRYLTESSLPSLQLTGVRIGAGGAVEAVNCGQHAPGVAALTPLKPRWTARLPKRSRIPPIF
jgi:hypothetical protein